MQVAGAQRGAGKAEADATPRRRTDRPPRARQDSARAAWLIRAGLTVGIFLVTLPGVAYVPIGGLDPSYRAALHMALDRGVSFGGQIVYVFGPLGFLGAPTAYDPTTYPIAVVVALALHLTLVAAVVTFLHRASDSSLPGVLLTGVGAYFVARVAGRLLQQLATPELITLLLVLACLELLRGGGRGPQRVVLGGLAALGAAAALVKFNAGVVPLAAVGVTCLTLPTRGPALRTIVERLAAAGLGAAAAFLGLWAGTGQRLADLVPYVRDSLAMSAGHVEAMAVEAPGQRWEYAGAVVVVALLAALVLSATRELPWLTRLGTYLVLAGYLLAIFRHGFVRHDGGHSPLFFIPLMIVALVWLPMGRRALNLTVAAVLTVVAFGVVASAIPLTPSLRGAQEAGQALAAIHPERQAEVVAGSRDRLRAEYGLSAETIALLSGHTVHVEPWETALLWAYPEFRWGPVPVFQPIVAYTAELDERNAALLTSQDAPEFVLQEVAAIDGHNPLFESPAHMLALVCHYEQVRDDGRYQVLRHVGNRCGEAQPAGTGQFAYGEYSDTPEVAADELLVASFERLDPQPWDAVRSLLLKPRTLTFVGDRDDPTARWRFVRGHAANPHLVDPPDCLGWGDRFLASQPYDELTLHPTGHPDPGFDGGYTVSYSRVPFRCS